MITNDKKKMDIDFGLHVVSSEYGYTVLCGESKDYPVGGLITEFTNIYPPDIKDAILTCKKFFNYALYSDEASEGLVFLRGELEKKFGLATSAMIITEFLNILGDYSEAKKTDRVDELLEVTKKGVSPVIKDFVFENTGYSDIGFEDFGQSILTAYLSFSTSIAVVQFSFASLVDDDKYGHTDPERAYSLINSMCSDLIEAQHIDFRIIAYDNAYKRMYTINSAFSPLLFEVINCLEHEVHITKCKNCRKLFVPEGRKDTLYCSNPSPQNQNKTCREIGAQVARANKEKNDVVTKEYRKRYLAHKMKVRRHPGNIQYSRVLDELTTGMKEWREKLKDGSDTVEQFMEWLEKY